MRLKSGRQFRSYVISWFLMVVGLIVVFAGFAFYHTARDYLLSQYKQTKLAQVMAMAALIDGKQHTELARSNTTSQASFERLLSAYRNTAEHETNSIYSLNYDPKTKKFRYVVDNAISNKDAIHVLSSEFDLLLSLDNGGQLRAHSLAKPTEYERAQSSRVVAFSKTKRYPITLEIDGKRIRLMCAGKEILAVTQLEPLTASYGNILLHKNSSKRHRANVVIDEPLAVSYRFVKAGQPQHIPGSEFVASQALVTSLSRSLTRVQADEFKVIPNTMDSTMLLLAPIDSNAEAPTNILVMQISSDSLKQVYDRFIQSLFVVYSAAVVLLMIAAIFFARKITGPLEQLTLAITRLIRNDFNFKLSNKGFGSFGFLADQFNSMLARIQQSRNELINLNKSYSRFVPHQLLKQLSVSGVNDISLGDSCEREMTVLFCDIRGFTTLSESMTPEANFLFINRYLNEIAPVINKRGGIIDKYMGDGIMALFPNHADDAVMAAIEMLQALEQYNRKSVQNNLPAVKVGLGVHSGSMMLGTVGTPSRMDATVVSDTVNAASRVESMTKAFSVQILITEETKRRLKDLSAYRLRYIASCSIQGKSKPVTLYEIFNHDPLSLQQEKSRNQAQMILAWKKYKSGRTAEAIFMYQKLIESSPNDKSLFSLIERCQTGRL